MFKTLDAFLAAAYDTAFEATIAAGEGIIAARKDAIANYGRAYACAVAVGHAPDFGNPLVAAYRVTIDPLVAARYAEEN